MKVCTKIEGVTFKRRHSINFICTLLRSVLNMVSNQGTTASRLTRWQWLGPRKQGLLTNNKRLSQPILCLEKATQWTTEHTDRCSKVCTKMEGVTFKRRHFYLHTFRKCFEHGFKSRNYGITFNKVTMTRTQETRTINKQKKIIIIYIVLRKGNSMNNRTYR